MPRSAMFRSFRRRRRALTSVIALIGVTVCSTYVTASAVSTPQDLGVLPGGLESSGLFINSSGNVAGAAVPTGSFVTHATFWSPGTGLVDLGTLGGTGFNDNSYPTGLNDADQVIGVSFTPVPRQRGFIWSATEGIVDLGVLSPDDESSRALDINNSGMVVGVSQDDDAPSSVRSFWWTQAAGMNPIPAVPGFPNSWVLAVNDAGGVIGTAWGSAGGTAFYWNGSLAAPIEIPPLAGGFGVNPVDINNLGQVVGTSFDLDGPEAFVWTVGGGTVGLGALGDYGSEGVAINDAGQVTGTSTNVSFDNDAFLWTPGSGMLDLGNLGSSGSTPRDVNELGHVTGVSYDVDWNSRPFMWTPADGMFDLGTLGGRFGWAEGVNDTDQVVGNSATSGDRQHATRWTVTPEVEQPADLSIVKEASAPVIGMGQMISYTLTVHNAGPGAATGVTVTDPLPAALGGASTATPGCSIVASTLTCAVGSLAAGANAVVTLTATATASTLLTNSATVAASETDPVPGDNVSSVDTVVYAAPAGGGAFVIGSKATTGNVTFWGAQWSKLNKVGPSSFKGYAKNPAVPTCGVTWSTAPGNSAPPPSGPLPAYMPVIVTNAASSAKSTISGTTASVVVVRTNTGYSGNPGHAGTGTIVATLCST